MNEIPKELKDAIKTLHDWCVGKSCSECHLFDHEVGCVLLDLEPFCYREELWQ